MNTKKGAVSPAIQNAQMDVPLEQETDKEAVFTNLFTEMAYKSFSGRYPALVEHIVDFEILNTDIDKGYGVGAFVIQFDGSEDIFMVPIVLESNTIQPMLFLYHQNLDTFLPLTENWIQEILKRLDEKEGDITKPKLEELHAGNSLSQINPINIQNNLPGIVGKYGSVNIDVPEAVSSLSNDAKDALHTFLSKNTKIASYFFTRYGMDALKKSFKKNAEEESEPKKDIVVATPETPLDIIKKDFGKDHVVMESITQKGYAVKDTRDTTNKMVVFTDYANQLENPTESGTYEIYLSTGKTTPVLILQDPVLIDAVDCCTPTTGMDGNYKHYQVQAKNKCIVMFPDGKYKIMKNDNILATPVVAESLEGTKIYPYIYGDKSDSIPIDKPFMFVKKTGNGYMCTGPIVVKTKVTDDGTTRCTTNWGDSAIIYGDKYKGNNIYVTKDNTIIVPSSFKVMSVGDEVFGNVIVGSMKTILTLMNCRLIEKGGKPLTIVKDRENNYGIESSRPIRKADTVVKIAREYDVNATDVDALLDIMDEKRLRIMTTYILPKQEKTAQMPMEMPQQQIMPPMGMMPQGMPQGMPQQGMPQAGMIPPELMQGGMDISSQLQNPEVFDTSALMSLSYISKIEEIFPKYLPNLMKALDSLARILLNFWMNAREIQDDIGVTEYSNLELQMQTLFKNLGELLLTLNKKVDIFQES
ncbi:MAG: hypothetical protein ACTSPI_00095 [Candidatus Heimdallarchaeaceae archaeon]